MRRAARRARAGAGLLAREVETVFLGGGTPTFTEPAALARLLAALPAAAETTVEANPETVTPALAALLREHGVNRVSLGAQSFQPRLLETLERRARPGDVRAARPHAPRGRFRQRLARPDLRHPGQSARRSRARPRGGARARARAPLLLRARGEAGHALHACARRELERQADAMEGYFERVVETLTAAGYRWYETANFCRVRRRPRPARAPQPRLLAGPRLPRDRDRRRLHGRRPPLAQRPEPAALRGGARARRAPAARARAARRRRRGARAGAPRPPARRAAARLAGLDAALDHERSSGSSGSASSSSGQARCLTRRGRFLGGGVTAELLV